MIFHYHPILGLQYFTCFNEVLKLNLSVFNSTSQETIDDIIKFINEQPMVFMDSNEVKEPEIEYCIWSNF